MSKDEVGKRERGKRAHWTILVNFVHGISENYCQNSDNGVHPSWDCRPNPEDQKNI